MPFSLELFYLVLCLVCGAYAAAAAKERGRNQYLWFLIGFVGSVVALAVINRLEKRWPRKAQKGG